MHKVYNILCGLLLAALLIIGGISLFDRDVTFSEVEDRELKTFPRISVSAIVDGSFARDLVDYYADTFPGREGMAGEKGLFDLFFGFTGVPEDAVAEK